VRLPRSAAFCRAAAGCAELPVGLPVASGERVVVHIPVGQDVLGHVPFLLDPFPLVLARDTNAAVHIR
jgi:hypothetical protein